MDPFNECDRKINGLRVEYANMKNELNLITDKMEGLRKEMIDISKEQEIIYMNKLKELEKKEKNNIERTNAISKKIEEIEKSSKKTDDDLKEICEDHKEFDNVLSSIDKIMMALCGQVAVKTIEFKEINPNQKIDNLLLNG